MDITLLLGGGRIVPADGVDDYARLLGEELSRRGHRVTIGRVLWDKNGSVRSLAAAARRPRAGCWVILQHTHLGWSRWGFPIRILPLAAALRLRGVKVAVIIHDPLPFGGRRVRDKVRTFTQIAVMRSLVALADRTLVTVDPSVIPWAGSKGRAALTFAPVGSNVGSAVGPREREASNKVVVFGVTEGHVVEARRISRVARTARSGLTALELCVIGRGAPQSSAVLRRELEGSDIRLTVHGVLPARDVASHIASADALLFLRGGASSRRGTVVAAIACGTPVVAERGPETSPPVTEAGVDLVPLGDDAGAALAIARIIEDPGWHAELSARNREVYARWFSWERIGTRVLEALL